ncbi:MAG: MBL fold metallo-hydrolase [Gammaproteobacteria bacterium]|nr:MBL fold metallo-hydrolase [Gammaproteobacteria bacterium]
MNFLRATAFLWALLSVAQSANASSHITDVDECNTQGLKVQTLGSGGGDFADHRAASGYLLWIDGKARVLIDTGSGTAMRFAESGAHATDLDVILFTHLHVNHTADLPMLINTAMNEARERPLTLYGPTGNRSAPSTVAFVRALLDGTRGAYRHLGGVLSPLSNDDFKLEVHDVREHPSSAMGTRNRRDNGDPVLPVHSGKTFQAAATTVINGAYPALAWRITVGNHQIVFSGDSNGEGGNLERLARNADLLIAHLAVREDASAADRARRMLPSTIGRIAAQAGVKRLVLSRRTRQTLGSEEATLAAVRTRYVGPVGFAEDLGCFAVY